MPSGLVDDFGKVPSLWVPQSLLFIPEGIYIQVNIWYLGVFQVYQWEVLAEIHKWEEIQQAE